MGIHHSSLRHGLYFQVVDNLVGVGQMRKRQCNDRGNLEFRGNRERMFHVALAGEVGVRRDILGYVHSGLSLQ